MKPKRRSIQGNPKIKPFGGLLMRSEEPDLDAVSKTRSSPQPFSDACRRILNRKVPHDPRRRTVLDLVVETIFLKALKGDLRAIKEITDRVEGRVAQPRPQEHDRRPAEIIVTYAKPLSPKSEESRVVNIAS